MFRSAIFVALGLALAACQQPPSTPDVVAPVADTVDVGTPETVAAAPTDSEGLIPYTRFQLDNGLTVLFHIDRSDPVVAVSLTAHVGSAREKPGRTGFAHLFEHLLFLESENLGKGGLDQLSARIGGSGANGSTSRDRTNYLQTVPNDALEKMLWAEADKLGWFINTVTEPVLAKEKEVVKNEKRQGIDNRPYGHTFYVLHKALYPEDHPYNWQVIGSLEDLQAAELQDVKDFFNDWYTPNNVTLVVAGDFDPEEATAWVERYFAEIPRGPEITPLTKRPGAVAETVRLFHEDNFADLPELTAAWPTVPLYHPDSYPLEVLAELLAVGKEAPLNEVLIDEEKLTSGVSTFPFNSELAGEFILQVRAFEGTDLDTVRDALHAGFARFEEEGISAEALERVKVRQEVAFYGALGSVLGKGVQLARCELFADDAGCIDQNLARLQAVTADDVMRVYETYIKGRPHVVTSFVPKGSPELALEGSVRAEVVEEPIVQGAEQEVDPNVTAEYEPTPSQIDRSVEPPYGPLPQAKTPEIWRLQLGNGLQYMGIEDYELPLVRFELVVDGGAYFMDTVETAGTANLVAEVLTRGTKYKTPAELENALALLGADIQAEAGLTSFTISGQTLARNFDATMDLLEEIVFDPRWDEAEFGLAKARVADGLKNSATNPNTLAFRALNLVTYGEDSRRAYPVAGGLGRIEAITLDDLKAWHEEYMAPNRASLRVVGAVDPATVEAALADFERRWEPRAFIQIAENPTPPVNESTVYFYDIPGAKQTVLAFSRPALTRTDPNFDAADIMNYRLGGGGFASRLTQELREGKGYTYGIFSDFDGTDRVGDFSIFSGVRANVTLEAAVLVKDIITNYAGTYTQNDLDVTKSFITKSQARSVESLGAKLGVLGNIADYDLPEDYLAQRVATAQAMTVEDVQTIARAQIRPDAMNYVFVGDAETQLERLTALGFGEPVLINERVDALVE